MHYWPPSCTPTLEFNRSSMVALVKQIFLYSASCALRAQLNKVFRIIILTFCYDLFIIELTYSNFNPLRILQIYPYLWSRLHKAHLVCRYYSEDNNGNYCCCSHNNNKPHQSRQSFHCQYDSH